MSLRPRSPGGGGASCSAEPIAGPDRPAVKTAGLYNETGRRRLVARAGGLRCVSPRPRSAGGGGASPLHRPPRPRGPPAARIARRLKPRASLTKPPAAGSGSPRRRALVHEPATSVARRWRRITDSSVCPSGGPPAQIARRLKPRACRTKPAAAGSGSPRRPTLVHEPATSVAGRRW